MKLTNFTKNGIITILAILLFMNFIGLAEVYHQNQILEKRIEQEAETNALLEANLYETQDQLEELNNKVEN